MARAAFTNVVKRFGTVEAVRDLSLEIADGELMAADVISFARGAPSADILPADAVREAASAALAEDWQRALSYGTGFGHPDLCAWVATELHGIEPEQVMFTNGSMEAAALLFRYMIEPGDRVAIWAPNIHEWVAALIGVHGAGAVLVPINTRFRGAEAADVLRRSGARLLFTVLRGAYLVTTSDGTSRTFGPGDVLLVEDTTGRGHSSRSLADDSIAQVTRLS